MSDVFTIVKGDKVCDEPLSSLHKDADHLKMTKLARMTAKDKFGNR